MAKEKFEIRTQSRAPEARLRLIKDSYTASHSERVANLSVRLGAVLGLQRRALHILRIAGLLHDIGKVAVPTPVLRKAGALTPDEWVHIRRHPEAGERIVSSMGMQEIVGLAVRHHHERWDGSGYPDGISGTDIPLLARVVSVVDVFDALTSERCYRAARSAGEAVAIMEAQAGRMFDPDILDRFLRAAVFRRARLDVSAAG